MMYDAMSYDEQLRTIMKQNRKQKGLSSAEFLGGFRKDDKVIPTFTLVVYYGQEEWNGALDLHGIMELEQMPPEVKNLIHNYPINLLQVRQFGSAERFQTDLRAVFGFLQNARTKEKLKNFIHKHQQDFEELSEDAYDVIVQLTDTNDLIKYKDKHKKEGGYDMCKAIDEMIEDGRNQGYMKGEAQGIMKGETRILRLTAAMIKDNSISQIERLAADDRFLQEMLLKYNI